MCDGTMCCIALKTFSTRPGKRLSRPAHPDRDTDRPPDRDADEHPVAGPGLVPDRVAVRITEYTDLTDFTE